MIRKTILIGTLVLLVGYLATGFFVVPSRARAVVTLNGRFVSVTDGTGPKLFRSGLHWTAPWPVGSVKQIFAGQVDSITVGTDRRGEVDYLTVHRADIANQYLTADSNLLEIGWTIHYRIDLDRVDRYLIEQPTLRQRLADRVKSELTALVAESLVDDIHPRGLVPLQSGLERRIASALDREGWGIVIDTVRIDSVRPPAEVQADFLDVSNARSERDRQIENASARAENRITLASVAASSRKQKAYADRERILALAETRARRLIALRTVATDGTARTRLMTRLHRELLRKVSVSAGRMIIHDGSAPLRLSIREVVPKPPTVRPITPKEP